MTFYFRPTWGEVPLFHARGFTALAYIGIAHRSWYLGLVKFRKGTAAEVAPEQES